MSTLLENESFCNKNSEIVYSLDQLSPLLLFCLLLSPHTNTPECVSICWVLLLSLILFYTHKHKNSSPSLYHLYTTPREWTHDYVVYFCFVAPLLSLCSFQSSSLHLYNLFVPLLLLYKSVNEEKERRFSPVNTWTLVLIYLFRFLLSNYVCTILWFTSPFTFLTLYVISSW